MKMQVIDISPNMSTLTVDLEGKFGPFSEFGMSNLEVGLDEKSREFEDLEKELKNAKKRGMEFHQQQFFLVYILSGSKRGHQTL